MTLFGFLGRGVLLLAVLAAFAYGLLAAQLFLIGENPLDFHVDPTMVASVDRDNEYLAAPAELSTTAPDRDSPVFDATPREVMEAFDVVALAQPRTKLAAGAPSELWATYVQRSGVFQFPDYISVVAIGLPEGGSTLAVYSQSVYGTQDLGVNKARIDNWISQIGETLSKPK